MYRDRTPVGIKRRQTLPGREIAILLSTAQISSTVDKRFGMGADCGRNVACSPQSDNAKIRCLEIELRRT